MPHSTKRKIEDVFVHIGVGIILLIVVAPVVWLFLTSFKKPVDVYAMPPKWLFTPTFENYNTLILERSFLHYFVNSVIVAGSTTVLCVFLGTIFSYALARFRFKGRDNLAFWVLSLRMLPPIAVILPYYLIFRNLRLLDTQFSLILVSRHTFNVGYRRHSFTRAS